MKRRFAISLRVLLPALLVGFAAIAGLISWKLNTRLLAGEIESQFLDEAKLRIAGVQAVLEYHDRKNDATGMGLVLSGLAAHNDVIAAYVLDGQDRIVAGTKAALIGEAEDAIEAGLPDDLKGKHAARRAEVRDSTNGSMVLSHDGRVAVAYYPLSMDVDDPVLRTARSGVLVVMLDMQIAKGRAFEAAGRQALNHALVFGGLAALAWVLIHFSLTGRVAALVSTTRQLASGDLTARTGMAGSDELGQVGKAFDLMAGRIAEDILRRKQVESELRESELRFREMAETIQQVFWMVSATDRKLIYISPAYEQIWGRTCASIYAAPDSWQNAIVEEDRAAAGLDLGRAANREAYDAEYRISRPDGTQRWIHDRGFPVRDANEQVVRICGIAEDITHRKNTETALRQSQRHLRGLIDGLGPSIFVGLLTPEGILVEVNEAPLAAAGLKPEDVIGKPYDEAPWWAHSAAARLQLRDAIARAARGEASRYDVRTRGVGDEVIDIDFSLRPLRDETGAVVYLVPSASVITERIRTEEALEASRQHLEAIINSVNGIVWEADAQTFQFTFVSQKAVQILGYPTERWLAEPTFWRDHLHAEDRAWAVNNCKVATQEMRSHVVEYRMIAADGREVWLKDIVTVIGEAGRPVKLRGIFVDITESKRAEASVRHSEKRLQVAIQASNLGPWDWNLVTNQVHFSPEWKRQLGYTDQEITGHVDEFRTRLHPEDCERIMSAVQEFRTDRDKGYDVEFRMLHKNGSYRWIHTRGSLLFDAEDKPFRMLGCHLDITERKHAAVALQESELRYRSLFSNMVEGYARCRLLPEPGQAPDFIYLEVNSAFEKLTGLKQVTGKRVSEVIPGFQETHPEVLGIYSRVASTGMTERFETYVEALGIWLSITVYGHDKEHFVAVFDNITERKRADDALRESQQRLAMATKSGHIGIWEWDVTANKLVWDTQMYELYGIREADFSGAYDAWQKGLHPEDRERGDAAIHAALDGAKDFHIEFRVVWPTGEVRHIEGQALVQRGGDGSATRITGVNRDITERKRSEAALEAAHKELVDASHQAGMAEVATSVLHNVGNVLNSVNISASLVADSVKKSKASDLAQVVALLKEHEHHLGTFITNDDRGKHVPAYLAQLSELLMTEQAAIVRELDSLQQNIEHIKEIVAMQQNHATVAGVKEMVNVVDLVEDSLRMNEGALGRHHVEVIREFEKVPDISGEKHKILQILVNLLSNAKHACKDSKRRDRQLTVRLANGDGRVKISVIDNGVGIAAENLTRIYNYGFTTRKGGHGFGLHSGALAAKEMGGSLSAQSDGPGQGAMFTLELPCPAQENPHE